MSSEEKSAHFIHEAIAADRAAGKHGGAVRTRFPPEPNGFLHLGHAKSICLNFGMAKAFGGECNLRFDDTNPEKEEDLYVQSIREDVRWLGFQWARECYASDYFETLFEFALRLIREGLAYVCELSGEDIRAHRGTLTEPGRPSPFRDRSPEENEALLQQMRAGEFPDGSRVLRARIDMAHPNLNLRDPVLYRIRRRPHHRTGDAWCIYPSYDFAHGQSDALEEITHSLCTLEFEDHRPLYQWFIEKLDLFPSRQIEFARLNLSYTVMSKRKLLQLVEEKHVSGWDDPRMPTLSGIRRRGVPPAAIRSFCEEIGVTKYTGLTDIALFEHAVRQELNRVAQRRMVVMNPLKVTLTNYPEAAPTTVQAVNNPEDSSAGSREIPFGRTLWIDRDDFMLDPPRKFFRLGPGREVRLRYAYIIRCDEVLTDDAGEVVELKCHVDMDTLDRNPEDRKVKGVIHWVPGPEAVPVEVRLYDRLFTVERPDAEADRPFTDFLNPASEQRVEALAEPSLGAPEVAAHVQFERVGYFVADPDSAPGKPVFNRTVALRDSWAKTSFKS